MKAVRGGWIGFEQSEQRNSLVKNTQPAHSIEEHKIKVNTVLHLLVKCWKTKRPKLAMVSNRALEKQQQWNILAPSNKLPSKRFWRIRTTKTMERTRGLSDKPGSNKTSPCLSPWSWNPSFEIYANILKRVMKCSFLSAWISCSWDSSAKAKCHCWHHCQKRSFQNPRGRLQKRLAS